MCKKKVRSRQGVEMLAIGTKSFVIGKKARIRSAINKFSTANEYYKRYMYLKSAGLYQLMTVILKVYNECCVFSHTNSVLF